MKVLKGVVPTSPAAGPLYDDSGERILLGNLNDRTDGSGRVWLKAHKSNVMFSELSQYFIGFLQRGYSCKSISNVSSV